MVGATRKKKVQPKALTVPQLRKAFEKIDMETRKILAKHPIDDSSISEFQKTWKSTFHKEIDAGVAKSYLELNAKVRKHKGTRKEKRKGAQQKGGSAPVDYMLRPGLDGTHGNYLPYVSSGLGFYNSINNIAMDSDCGKVDVTPQISADMGSNQFHSGQQGMFGGQRMIQSSVPPSLLQDVQDSLLSRPLGSSPNVLNTKYQAR
jgi:hypothetical protein